MNSYYETAENETSSRNILQVRTKINQILGNFGKVKKMNFSSIFENISLDFLNGYHTEI